MRIPATPARFVFAIAAIALAGATFAQQEGDFAWDEETQGPLTRVREGGTPPVDPHQALTPYAIHLPQPTVVPTSGILTAPPEYAPVDGVIFRYNPTTFAAIVVDMVADLTKPGHDEIAYVIVAIEQHKNTAMAQFAAAGADLSKVVFFIEPTDSIWIRDYGPHFIWQDGAEAIVDSHYYPTRPLDNFIPTLLADNDYKMPSYDIGLYYSGGNFQSSANRHGWVTSLIHQDNPGFGEAFIAELYGAYQGIDTLHVFPRLPQAVDGTGHIDMWLYHVDEDTVIISEFVPGEDPTAIQITNDAAVYMAGLGYEVFRVPDENRFHPGDPNCHFTYVNAFRVNDRIYIPTYGDGDAYFLARDAQAIATWEAAAGPGVEIVPIPSWDIIYAAGAIHCIVMQVPRRVDEDPAACVAAPTGGELLVSGTKSTILWTTTDNDAIDYVELSYSTDGGGSYEDTIIVDPLDRGFYPWTIPALETEQAMVKLTAFDELGNSVESTSETSFTIKSSLQHVYDFSSGAGTDKWAYGYQTTSWAVVNSTRFPPGASTEVINFSPTAYTRLAESDATGPDNDANRYIAPIPPGANETTHVFDFIIDEDPYFIEDIGIVWEGYGDQCLQMELYVWDNVAQLWCDGKGLCGENRFMDNWSGNIDAKLSGHIRSDFDRFIDNDGHLTILLYGERFNQESFHDYVSVTVTYDNCPFASNPDQADFDSDGWGDVCDNCPEDANGAQTDGDGDLWGDACDCAPADLGAFASPGEVGNVLVLGNKQTLQWDSAAATSGTDTAYDVLRGEVAGFPVGTGAEVCADTSVAVTQYDETEDPDSGEGFYYLIRGVNTCGVGGYGTDSSGAERNSSACP
jgi:agmatine deiminase